MTDDVLSDGLKRPTLSENLDFESKESIEKFTNEKKIIQPRRMQLNRKIRESYVLPRGSEKVIINQFKNK